MTLEAAFEDLVTHLQQLHEGLLGLRTTVVEDKPLKGDSSKLSRASHRTPPPAQGCPLLHVVRRADAEASRPVLLPTVRRQSHGDGLG